jgi:hypothetical protein
MAASLGNGLENSKRPITGFDYPVTLAVALRHQVGGDDGTRTHGLLRHPDREKYFDYSHCFAGSQFLRNRRIFYFKSWLSFCCFSRNSLI